MEKGKYFKGIIHHYQGSAMWLALNAGHTEAAKILARKGAYCTKHEEARLGEKYTNFKQILKSEKQQARQGQESEGQEEGGEESTGERQEIRQWLDNLEFTKLREWLGKHKSKLQARFEAGQLPAVGWLHLAATMQSKIQSKNQLEAEINQNSREVQQLCQQIKNLQQKQQQLENRKQELQQQMQNIQEIAALEAENQSIALLGQLEAAALNKLEKKMENVYFTDSLDSGDVSTVFSMFNMDALFGRFKKNDIDHNLEVTLTTTVEHLQKQLEMDFSEAVELQWKLKLLENGEKGVARHLSKCSICSSANPAVLLREYGMTDDERKEFEAKMSNWKGFYFVTVNATSAALELNVAPALRQKFTTCLLRIQRVHKWKHLDD